MDPIILYLVLFLVVVILFSSGVYLAFYKRKIVGNPAPAWMANLPEPARSVRLKEFNKQINKAFTWKWFLEYWRGQRSPFNAWFTWTFFGTLLLVSIGGSVSVFLDAGHTQLMAEIFVIILLLYTTIAAIILWRCAVNSTIFYKYFARIFAVYILYNDLSRLISIIRYSQ